MPTHNNRTVLEIRKQGGIAQTVEKYNHITKRRQDLFTFVDVIGVGDTVHMIQVCARCDMSKRRRKIEDEHPDELRRLRKAGCLIQIWGWDKYKNRWRYIIEDL